MVQERQFKSVAPGPIEGQLPEPGETQAPRPGETQAPGPVEAQAPRQVENEAPEPAQSVFPDRFIFWTWPSVFLKTTSMCSFHNTGQVST
jgi:hypothetical protein